MSKISILASALLLAAAPLAHGQTVTRLKNSPPDGAVIAFVLTNGAVLAQGAGLYDWYKLTPDNAGSYVNGTWTQAASLPPGYQPDAFASTVLADGRVIIAGGEYNFGQFKLTSRSAIYDPVANTWTTLSPPPGWGFIGDSPSSILPNGHYLIGDKIDQRIADLDPATMKWTEFKSTGKADFNAEEGWTLLPNGSVLTYDVKDAPNSEIYDPASEVWTSAGSTVVDLHSPPAEKSIGYGHGKVYHPPGEVGPGILRPDGSVFATGGTPSGGTFGHTAIYTPPAGGSGAGAWAAGPNFPPGEDAGDSFASLLPTGNVLVEAESGRLYEFDGGVLKATGFNAGGLLLVLPSGEILLGGNAVYKAAGAVDPAWAPTITSAPSRLTRGATYPIAGRQFNGLSQANAFGDEYQTNTNYPLVRITNSASGHVIYARTHGHSSMGVATGNAIITTNFDVPAAAEAGAGKLVVVANGIASVPVDVTVR
ncbi:MAG: kelch repeat-containing protein [Caulobacteraceae bacterium]